MNNRIPAMARARLFLAVLTLLVVFLLLWTARAQADEYNITKVTTEGGLEAWLIEDHAVPVVSLRFAFRGGVPLDPPDKTGLASLLSTMLDEGAGEYDSEAFQRVLDDNAIELGFSAGREAFYGNLRTLSDRKELAFDLTRLAITEPRFDADPLERMKNAALSDISSSLSNPNWIAARSFNGMLFEGHPYARPGRGRLDTIPAITADDLRTFLKTRLGRDRLLIAVAGDITAKELGPVLDKIFGGLPEKSNGEEIPDAELQYPGKTILLPYQVPQTIIRMAQPGIARLDPDWHAAQVMNQILGAGGFGSRLMAELREKRGLTYGVYSSIDAMERTNMLRVSLSTVNQSASESLDLIRGEWNKMLEDGVTEQEVDDAKSYLIGALLLQMTSTKDIAAVLLSLQIDRLGIDYLSHRTEMIEKVTPADVNRVARKLLKPDALTTVMVGQPEGIVADIVLEKPPGVAD